MDNTLQPLPPIEDSAPEKAQGLWGFIASHKKIMLVVICLIFLISFAIYFLWMKKNGLPSNKSNPLNELPQEEGTARMEISTNQDTYTLNQSVTVSVIATTEKTNVTGFDALIEYDPTFLDFTTKNTTPLKDFTYFGKKNPHTVLISGVINPDASQTAFNKTSLFEIGFTAKKTGKTNVKIVYIPSSMVDSNVINRENHDVLVNGNVKEIEIK